MPVGRYRCKLPRINQVVVILSRDRMTSATAVLVERHMLGAEPIVVPQRYLSLVEGRMLSSRKDRRISQQQPTQKSFAESVLFSLIGV